jgi:hypothetical protein
LRERPGKGEDSPSTPLPRLPLNFVISFIFFKILIKFMRFLDLIVPVVVWD